MDSFAEGNGRDRLFSQFSRGFLLVFEFSQPLTISVFWDDLLAGSGL